MSFFLVTSSVALEPDWPRDLKYSGSSIKRSANGLGKFVRYIEHLDFTNFRKNNQNVRCIEVYNDYFTKPSIPGSEQLPQYLAVYSYGIETQEQVKSCLKKNHCTHKCYPFWHSPFITC